MEIRDLFISVHCFKQNTYRNMVRFNTHWKKTRIRKKDTKYFLKSLKTESKNKKHGKEKKKKNTGRLCSTWNMHLRVQCIIT